MPRFNETKDSIRPWLHQYETLIKKQNIQLDECLNHVRKFLPQRVILFINNLPSDQRGDWKSLSASLLLRFATTANIIDDSDIWSKVCDMKQHKQPFHLYAAHWRNELNRMSSQKSQEEQIEHFIISLADDRVISALAAIVASTTNYTLNDVINSGLKIDRIINGIVNKQKGDFTYQPSTQQQQSYKVETASTTMDDDGDIVMGTNKIRQKHFKKPCQNSQRSNDTQTQKDAQTQQHCKFCKTKSHTHLKCFSRKNPDRYQRAKNYEQFKNKNGPWY